MWFILIIAMSTPVISILFGIYFLITRMEMAVVAIFFIMFGTIVISVIGRLHVLDVRTKMHILRDGLLAHGKIVGHGQREEVIDGDTVSQDYLIIEFQSDGKMRREDNYVDSHLLRRYPVGTKFDLLHIPDKEEILVPEMYV